MDVRANFSCFEMKQGSRVQLLHAADAIFWFDVPCREAVQRCLRNISGSDLPWGEEAIAMGG